MRTARRFVVVVSCVAIAAVALVPNASATDSSATASPTATPAERSAADAPEPRAARVAVTLKPGRTKLIAFTNVPGLPRIGVAKIRATVAVTSPRAGSISIRPRSGSKSTTIRFKAGRSKVASLARHPGNPQGWTVRNNGARKARVVVTVTGHTLAPTNSDSPSNPTPPTGEDTPREVDHSPGPIGSDGRYDAGTFSGTDIYVNPSTGSDSNSGNSAGSPLRTITAAWARIPMGQELTTGRRVQLAPGTYPSAQMPHYWENRRGTYASPIIFNATGGPGTAILQGDVNLFGSSYVYFMGLDISRDGDAFHCEQCSNILIRDTAMNGDANPGGDQAHETIKINQSDHIFIEDSTIAGAGDNAIDFVAVQYGHLRGNRISNSESWCAYVKGGSAYLIVAENEIYDCGEGGFTAGQGAGIEFTTSPWTTYEAMDIKVVNNIIHHVYGAGLGVNGGYNILLAYNTVYRVGARSHLVEFVFGLHSCDGGSDEPRCSQRLADGGWGVTNGTEAYIPNKHVYFYNNVLLNPAGYQSGYQHFAIHSPRSQPVGAVAPNPAHSDTDLRIAGNVIWNGNSSMPLGIEDGGGCQSGNPTCTQALIRSNNLINSTQPTFVDAAGLDFIPLAGGALANQAAVAIPSFDWSDKPHPDIPHGSTSNAVPTDRAGNARSGWGRPGAY